MTNPADICRECELAQSVKELADYIELKIKHCVELEWGHNLNGDWGIAQLYEYQKMAFEDVLNHVNKTSNKGGVDSYDEP